MKNSVKNRTLAFVLAVMLLINVLPFAVFADVLGEATTNTEQNDTTDNTTQDGTITEGPENGENFEGVEEEEEIDYDAVAIDVVSAEELALALSEKVEVIRIISSFELDRTFYISSSTVIYSNEPIVLTRKADFGGDIFVVGEKEDKSELEAPVTLTLGKPGLESENLLTIDGNKANMTTEVLGTVIFAVGESVVNLHPSVTIKNCKKVGNEKTLDDYTVSYPLRVGGPVAILTGGTTMNIYGGSYSFNEVIDITDSSTDEGNLSSQGGVIYNYGTLNVYGGIFEGNYAARAGVFYNYRTLNIYSAEIKNNTASSLGGAIYMPASGLSFLTIGEENDVCESYVTFSGNTSLSNGGAIYSQNEVTIKNASFIGNSAGGHGGAIVCYNIELEMDNVKFVQNTATSYGGALYMATNNESDVYELVATNVEFRENTSARGGALYLSTDIRAEITGASFASNETTAYGGAIYQTGATVILCDASLTDNKSTTAGGTIYLTTGATFVGSRLNVSGSSTKNGGAIYSSDSKLSIYNSTFESNKATGNGGAINANAGTTFEAYNCDFISNKSEASGGAIMMYTGSGVTSIMHSCDFTSNEGISGGAIYFSSKSVVNMYSITGTSNHATRGGFLYITTTGTIVTLASTTVSGNTVTDGGPIIWGNSEGAKLYIDKVKYFDRDYTGEWNETYWESAIVNSLKVYDKDVTLPSYTDYETGKEIEPVVPITTATVSTADALESALLKGINYIRITESFEIDRTFYIPRSTTIYTLSSCTLTRAPGFGGDLFVVGEDAEGNVSENEVTLTLGNPDSKEENLLTIDGNKANMTVDVFGTVVFIVSGSNAVFHSNLTIKNCKKVANEKTAGEYGVSYPPRIGGPVVIVTNKASLTIYGGNYLNNEVNDMTASTDEGAVSSQGGVIYNFGTTNIYGGTFEGNHAARGGVFYNYRRMHIYNAIIKNNTSSSLGGVIYMPASTGSFLYIGEESDICESSVSFIGNSSLSSAGVIYAQNSIYIANAIFDGNSSVDSGGVIYAVSIEMTIENTTFVGNTSEAYASAIYLTGSNKNETVLELNMKDVTFEKNVSQRGSALYMGGSTRGYIKNAIFKENEASLNGGAIYLTGATLEIDGADFISNHSKDSLAGAVAVYSSSSIVMNDIYAYGNVSDDLAGFSYIKESKASIYNSLIENNEASTNGGALYAQTGATLELYNTIFRGNKAGTTGGALFLYTGEGVSSIIHSCTFESNQAVTGGAIYMSGKAVASFYNLVAKNNSSDKGGFLYITTTGTTLTLAGLTVEGNTATTGGPIIWGNSTGAKLIINKSLYTDNDYTGTYDSTYWASAIYNKLKTTDGNDEIPKYLDYGNEPYDNLIDAVDVSSADELESAIEAGYKNIRIVADFEIDRTFYITGNTTIFATAKRTLTRAKSFGGDMFVVGETKDGDSTLLLHGNAYLTLGNPLSQTENLLTIDGNKDNMEVVVSGAVIFICQSAVVNVYNGFTVQNCHKTENERVYKEDYILSRPNRIGGSFAIVASGTLNIYGGNFKSNSVDEEVIIGTEEEGRISTLGGLIYNNNNLNIYGGTFEGNVGARGGIVYNYRMVKILGGSFIGNHATVTGGVYYAPNSSAIHLYIGDVEGKVTNTVLFDGNTANNNGGVFYAAALSATVIYGNTIFQNNSAINGHGGVFAMYGQLTVRNTTFENNTAHGYGGAIYVTNSSSEYVTRFIELTDCTFEGNMAAYGGALMIYASSADFENGAIVTITRCDFVKNKASSEHVGSSKVNGGAIYVERKSKVTILDSLFSANTSNKEAGALYIGGESQVTIKDTEFKSNKIEEGGTHGGAIALRSSYLTLENVDFTKNSALSNGGAIYVSYQSARDINSKLVINGATFTSNSCEGSGGAIYTTRQDVENDWEILEIKGADFTGNKAFFNGGAIYTATAVKAYLKDVNFTNNAVTDEEDSNGGAIYLYASIVEIDTATFTGNSAQNDGGAMVTYSACEVKLNNITASGNTANLGGFLYSYKATVNIYSSEINQNTSLANGGAIYMYVGVTAGVYDTTFDSNHADGIAAALYIYTGGTQVTVQNCGFTNNTANGSGTWYISNSSLVDIYNVSASGNQATKGGFLYITTTGTVVNLAGVTVSQNTASEGGNVIWGNSTGAVLNIDKSQYTDLDTEITDGYWENAIYNALTVNEVALTIPSYENYVARKETTSATSKPKEPVSVEDVFSKSENTSEADINNIYGSFPKLDSSSNFMSDETTYFENINGEKVTVDSFIYASKATDGNTTVGEGLLIYQAMLYKKANPDENVSIAISAYRFSIAAAVNINRNSRYFGYMRNLYGQEYDQYGFVRISYLLITAAKMGINVRVIGHLDGYPTSSVDPNFYDYFTKKLDYACDPDYVENGVVGDYLDFNFCYWTLPNKGGTDMMHTKLCAVSHYLDKDGNVHKNAVWTGSSNLDGINNSGSNGNSGVQTATIISDHERIYQISVNYLKLLSEYCGQEQIYELQDLVAVRSTNQIALILAGLESEIPAEEQIVYLGSETDDVFELYFTPFGGSSSAWDEVNNPYCKYLREYYNSEDYVFFIWNVATYSSEFMLGSQMESIIVNKLYKDKNVNNKIFGTMGGFDISSLNGLTVGKDIGLISINQKQFGSIHSKDILMSYVKGGQRYYVSLLNSLNMHSGSMYYQSNFMLVVKEKSCDEGSVFFAMADHTSKGIVEHTYGEEKAYLPQDATLDGYFYRECLYCDKIEVTRTIHRESEWIVDRAPSAQANGIKHTECTVCGIIFKAKEFSLSGEEKETDLKAVTGSIFSNDPSSSIELNLNKAPLTIEAEIQLPREYNNRGGVIFSNFGTSAKDWLSFEIYANGKVRLYLKTGGEEYNVVFEKDIRSNSKTHIAVTIDEQIATLYVNGVMQQSASLGTSMPQISGQFKIGGDERASNQQYFKGIIYSVNIFDHVRGASEICKDMIIVSESENGLLHSSYLSSLVSDTSATYTASMIGQGFNASEKYEIGTLLSAPQTIEAIIQLSKSHSSRGGVIVGNYMSNSSEQISFEIYSNGQPRLFLSNKVTQQSVIFDTDVRSDTPTYLAVTISQGEASLYVNGEIKETKSLYTSCLGATDGFIIGGDERPGNEQYFKGKLYALNMFSDIRSEEEIRSDAQRLTISDDSLIYSKRFIKSGATYPSQESGATFDSTTTHSFPEAISTPKTIEAVIIAPTYVPRNGVIIGNWSEERGEYFNLEIVNHGKVRIYYVNGAGEIEDCLFTTDVRSNSKIHLAVTIDTGVASLYVNGQLLETAMLTKALPNTLERMKVGGDNRTGNHQYFKGTIYSVSVFDDVRTEYELLSDSLNGIAKDEDGLVYSVKLEGAENSRIKGETFASDKLYSVENVVNTPLTLEATIYVPTSYDNRAGVIFGNYKDPYTASALSLEVYYGGRIRLYIITENGIIEDALFRTDVRSSTESHIAVTIEGKQVSLYLNGVLKETKTLENAIPASLEGLKLGGDNRPSNSQYFKGEIYSAYIFNEIRSAEKILEDKNSVSSSEGSLVYASELVKPARGTVNDRYVLVGEVFNQSSNISTGTQGTMPNTIEALITLPLDYEGRAGVIVGSYKDGIGTCLNVEVVAGGRIRVYYVNEAGEIGDYIFSYDIRSSEPTYVVVTLENGTASLYVNAVSVQTLKTTVALPEDAGEIKVGSDNRYGGSQYFKGTIYNATLFDDVRTEAELACDIYGIDEKCEGLIFSTSFVKKYCDVYGHEESELICDYEKTDSQAGLYHRECLICGAITETKVSSSKESTSQDVDFESCGGFTPTVDKNSIGNILSSPLTFEALIQLSPETSGRGGVIVGNYFGYGSFDQVSIEIYTGGVPRLYYVNAGKASSIIFKTDIRSNEPTHVAIVVDGMDAKLYVNGQLKETIALTNAFITDATKDIVIGGDNRYGNSQYFKGTIYSVAMFDDVRTDEEIMLDRILIASDSEGLIYYGAFMSPWYGKSAVFVGDSITYGVNCSEEKYWELLEDSLQLSSVTALGVAGSCISATSDYGEKHEPLVNRYDSIPEADLIAVFMGTNDYGHDTPIGNIDDFGDVSFYGALNEIIPALLEKYPSSKLVFITPMHRYGYGTNSATNQAHTYDSNQNGVGHSLEDYVNAILNVCEKYSVSVIDLYSSLELDPSLEEVRESYIEDGLHPNSEGHKIIAEYLQGELEKLSNN